MTDDLKLTCELYVGIARRIAQQLSYTNAQDELPDGYIAHGYANVFEELGLELWAMGLASALDHRRGEPVTFEPDGPPLTVAPPYLRFAPPDAIRNGIRSGVTIPLRNIDSLLAAYLDLHCNFSIGLPSPVPSTRDPFPAEALEEPEAMALLESGYLARSGALVMWTDKASQAMFEAGLWDADGEHSDTVRRNKAAQQAALICADVPTDILDSLNQPFGRTTIIMEVLRTRWDGANWTDRPGRFRRPLDEEIAVAKAVIERLDAGAGH